MGMKDDGSQIAIYQSAQDVSKRACQTTEATSRSCDNCAVQKAKCIRSEDGKTCDRCKRLSKVCLANRPLKPPGRRRLLPPPRTPNPLAVTTTKPYRKEAKVKLPYTLNPFGTLFKDLEPMEELMVNEFINPSNFTQLMVMPRIGITMHKEAVQLFLRHFDDLQDGCFSMYGAFASAIGKTYPGFDGKANLQRATLALKKFSAMRLPETQDEFAMWIWLGLTVAIFAHCELGSPASSVRRTILAHMVNSREKGKEMRRHPLIVSFTTLDILECLIYRQRPVLDLDEECVVGYNSFPGLAAPLIRFLYRLCMINRMDVEYHDLVGLNELEREVEAWQPDVHPEDLANCSAAEASHVLTRTRVHKLAILLYIHRLQYPFGQEDSKAQTLASSIFSDLDLTTATIKRPLEWVTLPFLLASIESNEPEKRTKVLIDLDKYVDSISPKARAMAKDFLVSLWTVRNEKIGSSFRWMDIVDNLPPLCVYI